MFFGWVVAEVFLPFRVVPQVFPLGVVGHGPPNFWFWILVGPQPWFVFMYVRVCM